MSSTPFHDETGGSNFLDETAPEDVDFAAESEEIATDTSGEEHCTSAIFHRSRDFTVSGGVFTSNVTNKIYRAPREVAVDFRRIPLGDIYLQMQIDSSVVHCNWNSRGCVRRMYSATVDGRSSNMTVAIYQGDEAEETWREEISEHSSLRHPNFFQLFGIAHSSAMYGNIYYDDLIPFFTLLDRYLHSSPLTVYAYAHACGQYTEAQEYLRSIGGWLAFYCLWVRPSTGRVLIEPIKDVWGRPWHKHSYQPLLAIRQEQTLDMRILEKSDAEAAVSSSMSLQIYHRTAFEILSHRTSIFHSNWKPEAFSGPGLVMHLKRARHVASLRPEYSKELQVESRLFIFDPVTTKELIAMPNGWTRLAAQEIPSHSQICCGFKHKNPKLAEIWLSQANHIFDGLQGLPDLENFFLVEYTGFTLTLSWDPPQNCYLFLCPASDFYMGPSQYKWPKCPAYWSLDPSGVICLSPDEEKRLRVPLLNRELDHWGYYWDSAVYEGLRRFHQGKGFDPDSDEVARHLGYPLYEVVDEQPSDVLYAAEIPPVSGALEFLLCLKLALILFICLAWLYEKAK